MRMPRGRHPLPVLRAAVRDDAARPAPVRRSTVAGRRLPDQPGRAVPEGLDLGRAARPPGPAHRRRWSATAAGCGRPRWDEALDRIVAGRRAASRTRHGRDAVAVFGGGGLTNEKAYALGKFARVALRTRTIDYNGRFCMSSAAAAGNRAFGVDRGLPFPVTDLAAADAVLLVGANPAETMPPFVRHLTRSGRGGADRGRPAAHGRPPGAPALHLQPDAGHRPGAGQRAAAHRDHRGARRRGRTSPRAPPASTTVRADGRRSGGRSGSSGSPACPVADLRRGGRAARPAPTGRSS